MGKNIENLDKSAKFNIAKCPKFNLASAAKLTYNLASKFFKSHAKCYEKMVFHMVEHCPAFGLYEHSLGCSVFQEVRCPCTQL